MAIVDSACIHWLEKKGLRPNKIDKYIIDTIENNKFCIILNSENILIARSYALYLLYWVTRAENSNKNAIVLAHNYDQGLLVKKELMKFCNKIGLNVDSETIKATKFNNGCSLSVYRVHKNSATKEKISICFCMDMAEVKSHEYLANYKNINSLLEPDAKLITNSYPKKTNIFHKLFKDAEDGITNMKALRIYYWMIDDITPQWISDKISEIGEEEFNEKYNLIFYPKKNKSYTKSAKFENRIKNSFKKKDTYNNDETSI